MRRLSPLSLAAVIDTYRLYVLSVGGGDANSDDDGLEILDLAVSAP